MGHQRSNGRDRLLTLLAIGMLAFSPWAVSRADPPTTADELRDRLQAALNTGDSEAFLELFRWKGTDEEAARARAAAVFEQYSSETIDGIEFEPAEAGINDGVIHNAVRYRPNVEVEGSLEVTFSASSIAPGASTASISFPWGRADGAAWIASVIQEPVVDATGPPDRELAVEIYGQLSPTKVEFEATCDFVASGQKATKKFRGSGAQTQVFPGQRIDSCVIEKLGGEGWVQLRIRIDGELVFESDRTDLASPLRYRGG